MIINFSIQNFGSIKNKISLSFEATNSNDLQDYYIIEPKQGLRLLKLGIIFGPNASGKTTILRALQFLRNAILDPLEKKTEVFDYSPFLFDEDSSNLNTIFSLEFFQEGVKYLYELEIKRTHIVTEALYNFNPNKALVYNRETNPDKQITKINFGNKIKINKDYKSTLEANTLWNNTVLGGYLKTNFESHELSDVTKWFKDKLKKLITPHMELFPYVSNMLETNRINKDHIVEFLKKADFKISDISIHNDERIVDPEFIEFLAKNGMNIPENDLNKIKETGKMESKEMFFKHVIKEGSLEKAYDLSYNDESQGTQRFYQFSGLLDLMMKEQAIFAIDEIESSLHPDLLKHFLLTFLVNTKESQIIATTHHRELLMERDILRNDIIWFTEKQENGSTDLFSLVEFDSSIVRNTSSIFNAYKIGKLGAIPEFEDYYFNIDDEK